MVGQVSGEYSWLLAIFLVAVGAGLWTRTVRRVALFYLAVIALSIASLLWLYGTTRLPLSFLIPTSMGRTVDVFMVPCAMATAHLLAELMQRPASRYAGLR
jgi:hypothetical protein